jgi:hypothetical protein
MPQPHVPPYYHTNKEALEAISAAIYDHNRMIAGSRRVVLQAQQLLVQIDAAYRLQRVQSPD